MGQRGPSRKPYAIRALEGNAGHIAKSRWMRENEPRPEITAVDPPDDMPELARRTWDYLTDRLLELRVMSELDGPMLEVYCRTYALWRQVTTEAEQAQAAGETNPKLTRLSVQLFTAMRATAREFGLTPGSRAGIDTIPPRDDAEDELEALLD